MSRSQCLTLSGGVDILLKGALGIAPWTYLSILMVIRLNSRYVKSVYFNTSLNNRLAVHPRSSLVSHPFHK